MSLPSQGEARPEYREQKAAAFDNEELLKILPLAFVRAFEADSKIPLDFPLSIKTFSDVNEVVGCVITFRSNNARVCLCKKCAFGEGVCCQVSLNSYRTHLHEKNSGWKRARTKKPDLVSLAGKRKATDHLLPAERAIKVQVVAQPETITLSIHELEVIQLQCYEAGRLAALCLQPPCVSHMQTLTASVADVSHTQTLTPLVPISDSQIFVYQKEECPPLPPSSLSDLSLSASILDATMSRDLRGWKARVCVVAVVCTRTRASHSRCSYPRRVDSLYALQGM